MMQYNSYLGLRALTVSGAIITIPAIILGLFIPKLFWLLLFNLVAPAIGGATWVIFDDTRMPKVKHMRKPNKYKAVEREIVVKRHILGIPVWVAVDCTSCTLEAFTDEKIKWQETHIQSNQTLYI